MKNGQEEIVAEKSGTNLERFDFGKGLLSIPWGREHHLRIGILIVLSWSIVLGCNIGNIGLNIGLKLQIVVT